MTLTYPQYVAARIYQMFKMLVSDRNEPPSPAEVAMYEACFDFKREEKQCKK